MALLSGLMRKARAKPAADGDARQGQRHPALHAGRHPGVAQPAGDRRLLGALVRALQAARADPRARGQDRRRQGAAGQDQHRREPRARPAAAHPVDPDGLRASAAASRSTASPARCPRARSRRSSSASPGRSGRRRRRSRSSRPSSCAEAGQLERAAQALRADPRRRARQSRGARRRSRAARSRLGRLARGPRDPRAGAHGARQPRRGRRRPRRAQPGRGGRHAARARGARARGCRPNADDHEARLDLATVPVPARPGRGRDRPSADHRRARTANGRTRRRASS